MQATSIMTAFGMRTCGGCVLQIEIANFTARYPLVSVRLLMPDVVSVRGRDKVATRQETRWKPRE